MLDPLFLYWRRDRDSNPGTSKLVNGFRDRPDRPLRHLSELKNERCKTEISLPPNFQKRVQKYYFFAIWTNFFELRIKN